MKSKVFFSVAALGAVAFVAWRVQAINTRHPVQFEIVEDFSGSHGRHCASLQGLAKQVLQSPDASPSSTLTVLATGDHATADEPHRIATYSIPVVRRVAEGRSELLRQRVAILADLRAKCSAIPQTSVSPIFLGITNAVADLRSRGCSATSHCELFVDSDLEENVEPSIRERLDIVSRKLNPLPPAINNAGILVSFCGLAVTTRNSIVGKKRMKATLRDAMQDDRLRQTWLHLFTDPSTVRFAPYCPGASRTAVLTKGSSTRAAFDRQRLAALPL